MAPAMSVSRSDSVSAFFSSDRRPDFIGASSAASFGSCRTEYWSAFRSRQPALP